MQPHVPIVVTGMGALSAVGIGCETMFANLTAGVSGIAPITLFDPAPLDVRFAGEVKDFNPGLYLDRKIANRIGRYAQFAVAAVQEAIASAGLDLSQEDPGRVATLVASAIGDFPCLEEQMFKFFSKGPGRINPFTVPRVSTSMASGNISLVFNLTGPSYSVSSACATGSHALATAWLLLRAGLADVALVGGTESAICASFIESYIALRALSTRNDAPEKASRPFDRERDGFVMGEGCGVMVLETLDHARRRNSPILAELAGIGMTCDAYHITAAHPDGRGSADAMKLALVSAGLGPDGIDYIHAHGTATPINDPIETTAIKTAFGEQAYRIPINSIKSMIGHCIGAAGALSAVSAVMTLNRGIIPPTINLDNPDPACDLDYVPNEARRQECRAVMVNAFGFGGQNCVLVFRKY